jgi:hypothetical protein
VKRNAVAVTGASRARFPSGPGRDICRWVNAERSEPEPFEGARLKLARARHHRDDLHAEAAKFLKPGGGDARPHGVAFDRERRQNILVVRASFIAEHPPPADLGLIAGDLTNNLRAALDHFVADLNRGFGATPTQIREGAFPVTYSEKDFENRSDKMLGAVPRDSAAWQAIKEAQPFHADDPDAHPLAVIARLNNADKHRLLHPAFAYAPAAVGDGLDFVAVLDPAHLIAKTAKWRAGEPLKHGTELAVLRFAPGSPDKPVGASKGPVLVVSWGELSEARITFDDMIAAVENIVALGPDLLPDEAEASSG